MLKFIKLSVSSVLLYNADVSFLFSFKKIGRYNDQEDANFLRGVATEFLLDLSLELFVVVGRWKLWQM